MTPLQPPPLLDKKQLAAQLGCSLGSVQRMYQAGKLPHIRVGKRLVRFHLPAVIAALGQIPANEGN